MPEGQEGVLDRPQLGGWVELGQRGSLSPGQHSFWGGEVGDRDDHPPKVICSPWTAGADCPSPPGQALPTLSGCAWEPLCDALALSVHGGGLSLEQGLAVH